MMDKTWLNGADARLTRLLWVLYANVFFYASMDGIFCEPCLNLNRAIKEIECPMNGFIQAHPAL